MSQGYVLNTQMTIQLANGALRQITDQINQSLRSINGEINLRGAEASLGTIRNLSRGTTQLSTDFTRVAAAAKESASAVEAFGAQTALAARRFAAFAIGPGALVSIAYGFKSALAEAFLFEKELIRLEQISGSTKQQLQGVAQAASDLSQEFGVSSKELITSATALRQAGVAVDDLRTAMEAITKASLAPTFGDIEQATSGALGLIKQFNVQVGDLDANFGSINAVASRFSTEASEINTAISRTGAAFKAAGGSVNELIALFSAVRGTTRETAESVSTGLRTIFSRLQRSSTIDSLEQLGIRLRNTKEEAKALGDTSLEGNFVGAFEAAKRLGEALKNLSTTDPRFANIAEQLGGYRQIEKTIPLLQQMTTAQSAFNVALAGSASLNASAEKAQEGFLNQVTKLKEEVFGLGRELANDTTFRTFLTFLTDGAHAAVTIVDALKPLIPLLAAFGTVKLATALQPAVAGFAGRIAKPVLFADGGSVPGGYGGGDKVPARLEPGEFVLTKQVAKSIGYNKLNAINEGRETIDYRSTGDIATGGFGDLVRAAPAIRKKNKKYLEEQIWARLHAFENQNIKGFVKGGKVPDDDFFADDDRYPEYYNKNYNPESEKAYAKFGRKSRKVADRELSQRQNRNEETRESFREAPIGSKEGSVTVSTSLSSLSSYAKQFETSAASFSELVASIRQNIAENRNFAASLASSGKLIVEFSGDIATLRGVTSDKTHNVSSIGSAPFPAGRTDFLYPDSELQGPTQGRGIAINEVIPVAKRRDRRNRPIPVDYSALGVAGTYQLSDQIYRDPPGEIHGPISPIADLSAHEYQQDVLNARPSRQELRADASSRPGQYSGNLGIINQYKYALANAPDRESTLNILKDAQNNLRPSQYNLLALSHANQSHLTPTVAHPEDTSNHPQNLLISQYSEALRNAPDRQATLNTLRDAQSNLPRPFYNKIANLANQDHLQPLSELSPEGLQNKTKHEAIRAVTQFPHVADQILNIDKDTLSPAQLAIVQRHANIAREKKDEKRNISKEYLSALGGVDLEDSKPKPKIDSVSLEDATYSKAKGSVFNKEKIDIAQSSLVTRTAAKEQASLAIKEELIAAQASVYKATIKGISSQEALNKGLDFYNQAVLDGVKVIKESNEKHVFTRTIDEADQAGLTNIPGAGFLGAGSTRLDRARNLFKSSANSFSNVLPAFTKNPNLALGAGVLGSYASQTIDSNLPSAENAVASNSTSGLKAGRTLSGLLGGAATGAFAGSLLPLPPGVGTVVGAVVGAGIGLTNALSTVSKEIADVKLANSIKDIELNLRRFSDNLQSFDEFKASASTNIDSVREANFQSAKSQSTGFFSGFDSEAFGQTYNKLNNDTLGNAAPAIAQALSKQAQEIGKASPGKDLEEIKKNFNTANAGLISTIAGINKVDVSVFQKAFAKNIDDGLRNATQQKVESQTTAFIVSLERLTSGIESAVLATNDLQDKFHSIVNLAGGSIDPQKLNNITSNLNPFSPNRTAFTAALDTTAQGLGAGGAQFRQQGLAAQSVANVVAEILPTLLRESANTEAGNLTGRLNTAITSGISPEDAKLPEFKRAIELVSEKLASTNIADDLKKAGNDVSKFVQDTLGPNVGAFVEYSKKIAELQRQAGDALLGGLGAINSQSNKVAESFDKVNQAALASSRFGSELEAQRSGRPSSALDNLSVADLQSPFLQHQANLVGPGVNGLDPQAIANALTEVNKKIPGAKVEVEKTRGTDGFKAAADNLSKLTDESSKLLNALKGLSEQANLNSAIQTKLNKIEENRAGRLSLGERFIGSDSAGRNEIETNLLLIKAISSIDKQGNLSADSRSLPISQQQGVIREARSLGTAQIPLGNGKSASGNDIADKLIDTVFGGNVLGIKGKAAQDDLNAQKQANLKLAGTAEGLFGQQQESFLGDLKKTLVDVQSAYFAEIKRVDQQRDVTIALNDKNRTGIEGNKIGARTKDLATLNSVGVTDDASLSYAKTNQDKLFEYFALAKKEQNINQIKNSFDVSKITSFSGGIVKSLIDQGISESDAGKIGINFSNRKEREDNRVANTGIRTISNSQLLSNAVNEQLTASAKGELDKRQEIFDKLPSGLQRDKLPANLPSGVTVDQFSKALSSFDIGANRIADFADAVKKSTEDIKKASDALSSARFKQIKSDPFVGDFFSNGGMARGTDTVPAMLSPGEMIVNSKSAAANRSLLHRINNSGAKPVYLADGGILDDGLTPKRSIIVNGNDPDEFENRRKDIEYGDSSNLVKATRGVEDPDDALGSNVGFVLGRGLARRQNARAAQQKIDLRNSVKNAVTTQYFNRANNLIERQVLSQTGDAFGRFGYGKAGSEAQTNLFGNFAQAKDKADRKNEIERRHTIGGASDPLGFQQLFDREKLRRNGTQIRDLPLNIRGYAEGGSVDRIPAMLADGEFVMRKSAVDKIGSQTLNRWNHFADGGLVGGSATSRSSGPDSGVTDKLLVMFKSFDQSSSSLTKSFVLFDGSATKLAGILEKFPNKISIEGNQTLTIVANGVEAFAQMMPEVKKYVEAAINDGISKMIKDKIPDA